MDNVTKRLFFLAHCKKVSHQVITKLLKLDPTLDLLFTLRDHEWQTYFNVEKDKINTMKKEYHSFSFAFLVEKYKYNHIEFLSITDRNYPPLLKQIHDPPPFLFYKGDINLAHKHNLISVVGTRNPTKYGQSALEHLLEPLIQNEWIIVSGMALGIDTLAHEAALNHNGKTIAVIAGGLNHIYPKQNMSLAKELMSNHLILSEHSPSTLPQKWHFPMRNRIISGISRGTLIIQAKSKSGSLITANFAVQEGREVFALPGSVFSPYSSGANELIQQGAKLVKNPEDILEEFVY